MRIFVEYVPLYINSSRYNMHQIVNSLTTQVVTCDIYGVPMPTYTWMKDGEMYIQWPLVLLISSSSRITSNITVGPYVAVNGSLIIINAVHTNSGNYTCYGIHKLTIETISISLSYNIIILPEGKHFEFCVYSFIVSFSENTDSFNWYIFAIAAIIAVTLLFMFAIGVYFVASNSDICYNRDKIRYIHVDITFTHTHNYV